MLKKESGITYYSSPLLNSTASITHAFLGRTGGASTGSLSSLNMGRREGESTENIEENRKRVAGLFDLSPYQIFTVEQVHGDDIFIFDEIGADPAEIKKNKADAIISPLKHIAIGILTADCVPILLFDRRQRIIAAVHAGWRSTALRIAEKTVCSMKKTFGSSPEDIIAAIGPAIGACCYEVSDEVIEKIGSEYAVKKGDRRHADLPSANTAQLKGSGVTMIDNSGICTSCRTDIFFSHRKDGGDTGRQLSFISMKGV